MTHKFKEGDIAYYFTFPEDGCGGFDIEEIELHRIKVSKGQLGYSFLNYAFRSKTGAVNSIITKALNELDRIVLEQQLNENDYPH